VNQSSNPDAFRLIFKGGSLLDQSKAKPNGSLDWEKIQSKIAASKSPETSQSKSKYDSDAYLKQCREEDPWPEETQAATGAISLSGCRFVSPDSLIPDDDAQVQCTVHQEDPPVRGKVTFKLWVREPSTPDWTDLFEAADVAFGATAGDAVVETSLTLHCPMPEPELGTDLLYKVSCQSDPEAGPIESPETPVKLVNICRYVGGPELAFHNDGECPLLDDEGGLVEALVLVAKRLVAPPESGSESVIVFGFASAAGSGSHNRALSERRAKVVKSLLERDADSWAVLASANFNTKDLQRMLTGFANGFGWSCDPQGVDGEDGPKTREAVKAFQGECNDRYGLGLAVDGICGDKTWRAIHETLVRLALERMGDGAVWPAIPLGYPDGKGIYACGEDFANPSEDASDRHAEICLFAPGQEPKLKAPAPGAKATSADDPVEDPDKYKKVKLEPGGGGKPDAKVAVRQAGIATFRAGSAVPGPGSERRLVRALAVALREAALSEKPLFLVATGHADPGGSGGQELADARGRAVASLLTGDTSAWWEAVGSRRSEEDVHDWLTHLNKVHGWACDPSAEGVKGFQTESNLRFKTSLPLDGSMGEASWKALGQAISAFANVGGTGDLASVPAPLLGMGAQGWGGSDPSFQPDSKCHVLLCASDPKSFADLQDGLAKVGDEPSEDLEFAEEISGIECALYSNSGLVVLDEEVFHVKPRAVSELLLRTDADGILRLPDLPSGDYAFKSENGYTAEVGTSRFPTTYRLELYYLEGPDDPAVVADSSTPANEGSDQ